MNNENELLHLFALAELKDLSLSSPKKVEIDSNLLKRLSMISNSNSNIDQFIKNNT